MPGLHFIYDLQGRLPENDAAILNAVDTGLYDERYQRKVLRQDNFYFLAGTGYKEYPLEIFQFGDVSVYVEGYIYGTDTARKTKLTELAELAFSAGMNASQRIAEWLRCEAEFVIVLFQNKTGDAMIVNDLLGRLPLYCYRTLDTLIVSRDLRFIARQMDTVRFDRMALAQYLLFGYPLGSRTLLENVERVAPATCLRIDQRKAAIQSDSFYQFNVEAKEHATTGMAENAAALVDLFSDACRIRRVPALENVVSLSGGLDSKSIAACLHREGIPFSCVTYLDHAGNAAHDVPVARDLAQMFRANWSLYKLGPPTSRDVLKLLRIKNGMNPLGMAYLIPFLGAASKLFDGAVFFITGETSLCMYSDPHSPVPLTTFDELTENLIAQHRKLSLEDAATLTGLSRTEILDELRGVLVSYPEQDPEQKYDHFVLAERLMRWHSEGEDRNRCYFWSTSPFSGVDFFNYAIQCPDEQKARYGLSREFLRHLSPAAAAHEHAAMKAAITSSEFNTASRVAALLATRPERRMQLQKKLGLVRRYDAGSMVLDYLTRQLAEGDAILQYFSADALRHTVEHYADHSAEEFDHLFTVTLIIEDMTNGKSVLEA